MHLMKLWATCHFDILEIFVQILGLNVIRKTGINVMDISKYLYVCLNELLCAFFQTPILAKDRTKLERDKVTEKVRFMFMALHLNGCFLCLCVVVSAIR